MFTNFWFFASWGPSEFISQLLREWAYKREKYYLKSNQNTLSDAKRIKLPNLTKSRSLDSVLTI